MGHVTGWMVLTLWFCLFIAEWHIGYLMWKTMAKSKVIHQLFFFFHCWDFWFWQIAAYLLYESWFFLCRKGDGTLWEFLLVSVIMKTGPAKLSLWFTTTKDLLFQKPDKTGIGLHTWLTRHVQNQPLKIMENSGHHKSYTNCIILFIQFFSQIFKINKICSFIGCKHSANLELQNQNAI